MHTTTTTTTTTTTNNNNNTNNNHNKYYNINIIIVGACWEPVAVGVVPETIDEVGSGVVVVFWREGVRHLGDPGKGGTWEGMANLPSQSKRSLTPDSGRVLKYVQQGRLFSFSRREADAAQIRESGKQAAPHVVGESMSKR